MSSDKFVVGDLETFGLDPERDPIIEIAFVIVDLGLDVIDSFHTTMWNTDSEVRYERLLGAADAGDKGSQIVRDMHNNTDLFNTARRLGVNPDDAAIEAKKFLLEYGIGKEDPLMGSSISFDRSFLARQMPSVNDIFSYRIIDISSDKEKFRRWYPKMWAKAMKELAEETSAYFTQHVAIDDCYLSIAELKKYRQYFYPKADEA